MKWLIRCRWLAAWGVWLWLGFGLYWELPRDFGTPVCTLPVDPHLASPLDFIRGTNEFVVRSRFAPNLKHLKATIEVFDAETGTLLRQSPWPMFPLGILGDTYAECGHSVLFSKVWPTDDGPNTGEGVFVLDLRTMKPRLISRRQTQFLAMHPTRPLIAFFEQVSEPVPRKDLFLVNYFTLEETMLGSYDSRSWLYPFFTANPDRMIVATTGRTLGGDISNTRIEIWNLETNPMLERRIEEAAGFVASQSAANGRIIARFGSKSAPKIDVYDLNERRLMFAERSDSATMPNPDRLRFGDEVLSKSGISLFGGDSRAVWNIDSGKTILSFGRHESAFADSANNKVMVTEKWYWLWEHWAPNFKWTTYAHRNFDNGRLLFRTTSQSQIAPQRKDCSDGLFVGENCNVYRFPLPVNWPLLALCQTILALPLVLLWAVLRWRSRRAARRLVAAA